MVTFPIMLDIFVRNDSGSVVHVERIRLTTAHTYSIGRSSESDILLDAPEVSGKHAFLVADATGLVIEDRNSTNGTFIGEEEVRGAEPWSGDGRIRIGPYEIELVGQGDVVEQSFEVPLPSR
jgi:pSer/pThr/pTyr-binding forkhead associated (FHA) protein